MTAVSQVVPNREYRMKIVIADDAIDVTNNINNDTKFDVGVFLEAGSFNLGGGLGGDITVSNGKAICLGGEKKLSTGEATATHKWYKDGVLIPNETSPDLIVKQPGTYKVEIDFGVCGSTDEAIVEFIKPGVVVNAPDITLCDDGSGEGEFDLTINIAQALGQDQTLTEFNVKFFETQADADAGTPIIPEDSLKTYKSGSGKDIFIRVENIKGVSCYDTKSFKLKLVEPSATFTMAPTCDGATPTITGISGGTFVLEPDPGDGVKIDAKTGVVTGGKTSTQYTVKYTVSDGDDCFAEETVTLQP